MVLDCDSKESWRLRSISLVGTFVSLSPQPIKTDHSRQEGKKARKQIKKQAVHTLYSARESLTYTYDSVADIHFEKAGALHPLPWRLPQTGI